MKTKRNLVLLITLMIMALCIGGCQGTGGGRNRDRDRDDDSGSSHSSHTLSNDDKDGGDEKNGNAYEESESGREDEWYDEEAEKEAILMMEEESYNSSSDDDDTQSSNPDRPQTLEYRTYQGADEDNEWWWISVEILETGNWYMQLEGMGAYQIFMDYSFDKEAAGAYTVLNGYNLAMDMEVYSNEDMGSAKFTMTDNELLMQYEDAEQPMRFVRVRD